MPHHLEDAEVSEEEYDENADEDFNPDANTADANDDASVSEGEDDDAPATATTKPAQNGQKRKQHELDEQLDSGDEATIKERKRKKKHRKGAAADGQHEKDEESGGEGGMVRTRAQRLMEKTEKKQRRRNDGEGEVTVDVEALWADLSNAPVGRPPESARAPSPEADRENKSSTRTTTGKGDHDDDLITVTRPIEFAGEITHVTARVSRSSQEAQLHLAAQQRAPDSLSESRPLLRPLKRPSAFEPNPACTIRAVPPHKLRPHTPSRADAALLQSQLQRAEKAKAQKLTTVEKSAMDWRGFVEGQEGLAEELETYGKSREGFLEREDFLGRVGSGVEARGRDARMKG